MSCVSLRRCFALLFLILPGPVAASAVQGSHQEATIRPRTGTLFVPDDHVPLSEFAAKTPARSVVMHVHPDVLAWITAQPGGSVQVMVRTTNGRSVTLPATSVVGDTVTLTAPIAGDCVVVSDTLTHVLRADEAHSVQTHWDGTGAGSWSFGATDGVAVLGFDPLLGETKQGSIQNNDDLFPYTYDVGNYNLFSDGSGDRNVEQAIVPDFERYIGETYATNAPTNLRSVYLSDQVRAASGRPVAHRNAGAAGNELDEVEDGLPIFQLVHCHLVDIGNVYPLVPGNENSLGTFVLPPDWTSTAAAGTYPILFNGFYDIHSSTFGGVGQAFLEALG